MKLEGVPDGYEAVRFGQAKQGELFVATTGEIGVASTDHDQPRLIVRERPPIVIWKHGVFNNGWIAQDGESGRNRIFWFDKKPRQEDGRWEPKDDCQCCEVEFEMIRRSTIQFRDDVPWTERIVEVGPSVEK